jgi:hypothetical protein
VINAKVNELLDFSAGTFDNRDCLPVKVVRKDARKELRSSWSKLGRLHDDAIARRNCCRERRDHEVHWVVPRGDDENDTERLAKHPGASGSENQRNADSFRARPLLQTVSERIDFAFCGGNLSNPGFSLRFSQIVDERSTNRLSFILEEAAKRSQL